MISVFADQTTNCCRSRISIGGLACILLLLQFIQPFSAFSQNFPTRHRLSLSQPVKEHFHLIQSRVTPLLTIKEISRVRKSIPVSSLIRAATSSTMSSTMNPTRVKITSYNVLSSHLSAPSYFSSCKPEYCDPQYRFNKIKEKLDQEIASGSVICLQEISTLWAGYLHPYFVKNGYHLITALYGNKFNGYMGVGVAVPLAKYDINNVDITRIADVKRMPKKSRDETIVMKMLKTLNSWFWKLAQTLRLYKPPIDMWDSALYRHNQMICTRLQCKDTGRSFVVGTYHMPCMFELPSVMNVHCALSAQHIQRFAKDDPYLYVGDFNIKPDSSQYELLTKGTLEKTHPHYPHAVPGDEWIPDVKPPLLSAYATKNGTEPDFTNYARIREDPVFIATLDYIFHSNQWSVDAVEDLPHRDTVEGPLPNKDEPSDHILISAEMSLPPIHTAAAEEDKDKSIDQLL